MSNLKILIQKLLHDEESSAVWPYQETFFGGKINSSVNHPTFSHRRLPEVWGWREALAAFDKRWPGRIPVTAM